MAGEMATVGAGFPRLNKGSPAPMGSSLLHVHLQAPQKERATLHLQQAVCQQQNHRGATP